MKRTVDSSCGTRLSATALALITACAASVGFAACSTETSNDDFTLDDNDDDDTKETSGDGGSPGEGGSPSEGGSPPVGPGAQAYFEANVFPTLNADCGTCHGPVPTSGAPVLLAATATASYTVITTYAPSLLATPENSRLVQHGAHTGPALTPAQNTTVSEWLMMEVEERGLVGGPDDPPVGLTLSEALDEFAKCMDLVLWSETMDNMVNQQTANAGNCGGCHSSGDGGAFLSQNLEETFGMNKEFPYIKRLVTGTVDANGAFAGLLPAMRYQNKGLEAANCDPDLENCHPVYNLNPGNLEGYETFVDTTLASLDAEGLCTTPPPGP